MGCIFNCCNKEEIKEEAQEIAPYPSPSDSNVSLNISDENNSKFKGYQNMTTLKKLLNTILKDTPPTTWN